MRRRFKFASALMVIVLLSIGSGVILADRPYPPQVFEPTEPIITQSTKLEWVPVQTDEGVKQMLVPVTRIESMQTVTVPRTSVGKGGTAPEAMVDSVIVTQ